MQARWDRRAWRSSKKSLSRPLLFFYAATYRADRSPRQAIVSANFCPPELGLLIESDGEAAWPIWSRGIGKRVCSLGGVGGRSGRGRYTPGWVRSCSRMLPLVTGARSPSTLRESVLLMWGADGLKFRAPRPAISYIPQCGCGDRGARILCRGHLAGSNRQEIRLSRVTSQRPSNDYGTGLFRWLTQNTR